LQIHPNGEGPTTRVAASQPFAAGPTSSLARSATSPKYRGFLIVRSRSWPSGSSIDSEDAVAFSALTGVRPRVETFPLADAEKAYAHMMENRVRLRAVLVP
jgi:hypothetical protein